VKKIITVAILSLILCLSFATPVFADEGMDVDVVVVGDGSDVTVDQVGDDCTATVSTDTATVNTHDATVNSGGGTVIVDGENLNNLQRRSTDVVPWDFQNRQMIYALQDQLAGMGNGLGLTMDAVAKVIAALDEHDATLEDLGADTEGNEQAIEAALAELDSQLSQLEDLRTWGASSTEAHNILQEQVSGLRSQLQEENDYFVDAIGYERDEQASFMESVRASHELEQIQIAHLQNELKKQSVLTSYLFWGLGILAVIVISFGVLLIAQRRRTD